MSTFSGLSTALSSLIAQRQALDVTGQNIANANTVGYTRQRANLDAVSPASVPSLYSAGLMAGGGVRTTDITRMGDIFLDTRLRSETSAASYQLTRADALSRLQSTVTEPSDSGFASALQTYWADWQDVANAPDDIAARMVVVGDAEALVSQIHDGYRNVETQWSQTRATVDALVTDVNTLAASVADLNGQIRAMQVSGDNANELIDKRSTLITQLSGLVGATASQRTDGTMDVMIAGNPLVSGDRAHTVQVDGSHTMAGGLGEPPAALDQVRLSWTENGTALVPEGGQIAAHLGDLAPGGTLSSAVTMWNDLATSLATTVNAVHSAGQTLQDPPTTGVDFFAVDTGVPAALGLSVAISDPKDVAAASAANGPLDGSWADRIAQLATADGGPDQVWRDFVVDLGVRTRAAEQRSDVLEASRSNAETLQLSATSVDLDEESVNMLAYQRAYEGAARVITVMDEMLDVLINRTGTVGR
ncbi:flagellar hook-associated protein FlgK [Actinotalea sp. M2MS4P-6]|uniref:flagellar hook-associated protein FlgK n=1 Tax=Actinotalea sp. M2MS4P-6 TaxID=2983762 RepID=UPI0021E39EB6|nr:flagellar hook-associated protein FlgK [Actinotalea sp. M2MS4P-6]MCV2392800.1 flagellar hook-associated protein FlgK [Actinotalea sp. M2MS4P-6]